MGQCYSTQLLIRGKPREEVLAAMTNKFFRKYDETINSDCHTLKDVAYKMFTSTVEIKTISDITEITDAFDASYSWQSTMTEWFEEIAPVLGIGSEFWIYPDEGCCQLKVIEGDKYNEVTATFYDKADMVDLYPDKAELFARIAKALPGLDADASYRIRELITDYDTDIAYGLEEDDAIGEYVTQEEFDTIAGIADDFMREDIDCKYHDGEIDFADAIHRMARVDDFDEDSVIEHMSEIVHGVFTTEGENDIRDAVKQAKEEAYGRKETKE